MTFWEGLAATRDRVLPWFSATAAALTGRAVLLTALIVLGAIAVFWRPGWQAIRHQFTTPRDGQIIVNSPAVYTRQRLVNDRLAQSAWLQDQLRFTAREFEASFRSIDEVRGDLASRVTSIRAGVGKGDEKPQEGRPAAPPAAPLPTDSAKPDDQSGASPAVAPTTSDLFRAKNMYREEVRAEIMETQLDDRHDIQGNTIYRLSFDATVLPGTRTDAFAMIKVRLQHNWEDKDRTPGTRIDPIDQEYFQLYEDWLRYMQNLTTESIEVIAKKLSAREEPDLRLKHTLPNFLLRRICELTEIRHDFDRVPGSACDPSLQPHMRWRTPALDATIKRIVDYTSVFIDARNVIFKDHLKANIAKAVKDANNEVRDNARKQASSPEAQEPAKSAPSKDVPTSDEQTAAAYEYAINQSYQTCRQTGLPKITLKDWLSGNVMEVQCPNIAGPHEGLIAAAVLYNALVRRAPKTAEEADDFLSSLIQSLKEGCKLDNKATCDPPNVTTQQLRCMAADYMWASLNLFDRTSPFRFSAGRRLDRYFQVQLIGREFGNCGVLFTTLEREEKYDAVRWMKEDLNTDVEVYSYSITPKNLVQRLSTASDTRDVVQALLSANLSAAGRDLSSVLENLESRSTRSQRIQALPIVVGFGVAPESTNTQRTQTEFGWVVAPQIKPGKSEEREHTDRQYALAAVISVPSWWRSLQLTIETCWIDRSQLYQNQDFEYCRKVKDSKPIRHTVRLPGVIQELSRKLGFDVIQEPRLSHQYPIDDPLKVVMGRPAHVLLRGGRIWRSTEVTLGSQKADEIVVLPNMEGIIAKFKCVRRQENESRGGQAPDSVEIRVWTSEGMTEPEYATLIDPPELTAARTAAAKGGEPAKAPATAPDAKSAEPAKAPVTGPDTKPAVTAAVSFCRDEREPQAVAAPTKE